MRLIKILYWLLGLGLLVVVVSQVNPSDVWAEASGIGWGMAVVLGLYFSAFLIDSFTWLMAMEGVPPSARWLYRCFKVRMVGEVFNNVIPAAGIGGEPLKADLVKKHYGVGYREGIASLILAKTINTVSMVAFLAIGFVLIWGSDDLDMNYKLAGGAGLLVFVVGTVLFYAIQRWKMTTLAGTWLARFRFARRLEGGLHHIHDMDERLMRFYTAHRARFAGALFLAWINWVLGAVEIYFVLAFLGHPVSMAEAWIIEAAAQLVRNALFFIPLSLGAQEGAFLVVCAAITGSPTLGLAVAVVRRMREVLWLLWGATLGGIYALRSGLGAPDADTNADGGPIP